jgi:hypothetical protein
MDENLIEKILNKDLATKKIFLGCFARDELPAVPPFPSCFVFNTQARNQQGEHWLGLHFNSKGQATFFDSFGHDPHFYDLESYLSKVSGSWSFYKKRIQGSSDLCGLYCILFLVFCSRDKLVTFYNQFKNNQEKNDSMLAKYLI